MSDNAHPCNSAPLLPYVYLQPDEVGRCVWDARVARRDALRTKLEALRAEPVEIPGPRRRPEELVQPHLKAAVAGNTRAHRRGRP